MFKYYLSFEGLFKRHCPPPWSCFEWTPPSPQYALFLLWSPIAPSLHFPRVLSFSIVCYTLCQVLIPCWAMRSLRARFRHLCLPDGVVLEADAQEVSEQRRGERTRHPEEGIRQKPLLLPAAKWRIFITVCAFNLNHRLLLFQHFPLLGHFLWDAVLPISTFRFCLRCQPTSVVPGRCSQRKQSKKIWWKLFSAAAVAPALTLGTYSSRWGELRWDQEPRKQLLSGCYMEKNKKPRVKKSKARQEASG